MGAVAASDAGDGAGLPAHGACVRLQRVPVPAFDGRRLSHPTGDRVEAQRVRDDTAANLVDGLPLIDHAFDYGPKHDQCRRYGAHR